MCDYYQKSRKIKCSEKNDFCSTSCLLHRKFPKIKKSERYRVLFEKKRSEFLRKIDDEDFEFEGSQFWNENDFPIFNNLHFRLELINKKIKYLNLRDSVIPLLSFINCEIDSVVLDGSICDHIYLENTKIVRISGCSITKFGMLEINDSNVDFLSFDNSLIDCCFFRNSIINKNILFRNTTIKEIYFFNTTFNRDLNLSETKILGEVVFKRISIIGDLDFAVDKIKKNSAKESLFRKKKKILEEIGTKEAADKYHFLEMREIRLQSKKIRWIEKIFEEYVFKYGIYPWSIVKNWIVINFIFALIFFYTGSIKTLNPYLPDDSQNIFLASIFFSYTSSIRLPLSNIIYDNISIITTLIIFFQVLINLVLITGFVGSFIRKITR